MRWKGMAVGGALLAATVVGCGTKDEPAGPASPAGSPGSTEVRGTASTITPSTVIAATTVPPTSSSSSSSSSSTSAPGVSVAPSSTAPVPTQPLPTSATTIPVGTSAADKAWCVKAKPVTKQLVNLLLLTPAQLEDLVNQAMALKPTAPQPLQAPLGLLADVGGRFLAAVKSGTATISVEGVAAWANANLTQEQQQAFLRASGDVATWVGATCGPL